MAILRWLTALAMLLLAACATPAPEVAPPPPALFEDAAFAAPKHPPDAKRCLR